MHAGSKDIRDSSLPHEKIPTWHKYEQLLEDIIRKMKVYLIVLSYPYDLPAYARRLRPQFVGSAMVPIHKS